MRRAAAQNDANRAILLVIAFILSAVVLVAVARQMASNDKADALDVTLAIGTLVMAWLFANMVYALHYAHLFYSRDDGGKDNAGVKFPGTPLPDFPDFVYFSFTIGCSFAVSDTDVTSPHVRKVVTAHAIAAFLFNVGVLALTVNLLPERARRPRFRAAQATFGRAAIRQPPTISTAPASVYSETGSRKMSQPSAAAHRNALYSVTAR